MSDPTGEARRARARRAHEFKNHLTIILGFSDLILSDDALSVRHRQDLEEIRLAAQRALALLPEIVAPIQAADGDTPGGAR